MKVLITGITGMIGSHLADLYVSMGHEVAGISRATSFGRISKKTTPWKHYLGDILDERFLNKVWKDFNPGIVFHLAAQAYNGQSWEAEDSTYLLNVTGSRNVFKTCRDITPNATVIPACSSAEYGIVPEGNLPVREDYPLRPITPYGVSKACMEMMAYQFGANYSMRFVLPRLFIHVGPGHPPATALQAFAMQLAMIKLGKASPTLKTGNMETFRDFVDVRDGVRALAILADKGQAGHVYNVCSGKAWSIRESLDMLVSLSGVDVEIMQDKTLFRPSDEPVLLGNHEKISRLGWKRDVPFPQTLQDVFNNWIERFTAHAVVET